MPLPFGKDKKRAEKGKTDMEIKWDAHTKRHMELRTEHQVPYLAYPDLEDLPGFYHGFSTRLGGVSQGIYASMNLSFQRGDQEEHVLENYRRIAKALDFSLEKAVCSQQTHKTDIRVVTEEDGGKGILRPLDYQDIDGLMTNEEGVTLITSFADCVPLFFIDPIHRAVGLAHSGWRGTVARIGAHMVKKMGEYYHTEPSQLYTAIGPSICQACYEVSEDVALKFREEFRAQREEPGLLYEKNPGKYQLNLWRANEIVLLEAGVSPERILFPGICTCCNPELLFSHRASKGKRGNLSAFLGIRPSIE